MKHYPKLLEKNEYSENPGNFPWKDWQESPFPVKLAKTKN